MKPKTGLIFHSVLLTVCLALSALPYVLDLQGRVLLTQIGLWMIIIGQICSIVHFAQLKRKQAEQLGLEEDVREKTDQLS
jgi:hypothetical protein